MPLEEIWNKCLSIIEKKVGDNVYELWFKPIKLAQFKEQNAVLDIPNRFFRDWIDDYYPALLTDVLGEVSGQPVSVKLRVAEKIDPETRKMDARLEVRKQRLASKGIYLNPKYVFDNFITGPSNQFAHAAAMAVAEAPGLSYNPLFIYGGVGLGKTHLITAIGNKIADRKKDFNILYVSSEQFTNEVVSAIRHGKTEELKKKYRNLDLLLVDDVQFIENKAATQEELFYTINALYEKQSQIVISSDRPPKEIKTITDRLRSRFGMGLIADIQSPEPELKMAIIQKKAEMERIRLSDDVVSFLASRIKSSIRELEGCLIRLGAHSSLTGCPIDVAMAKNILRDVLVEENIPITVEIIQKTVAEHFGIKYLDMKSKKRNKEIAIPRQIAMYISRQLTGSSLSDIGKNFGGKDHATVIYACKQIEDKRAKDEDFNKRIETLKNKIKI